MTQDRIHFVEFLRGVECRPAPEGKDPSDTVELNQELRRKQFDLME